MPANLSLMSLRALLLLLLIPRGFDCRKREREREREQKVEGTTSILVCTCAPVQQWPLHVYSLALSFFHLLCPCMCAHSLSLRSLSIERASHRLMPCREAGSCTNLEKRRTYEVFNLSFLSLSPARFFPRAPKSE